MTENGPRGCVIHSLGLFCGIETGIGVCVVAFKLLAGPETDIEGGNCCKLCHSRCNCYYIRVASKLITNITTHHFRAVLPCFPLSCFPLSSFQTSNPPPLSNPDVGADKPDNSSLIL